MTTERIRVWTIWSQSPTLELSGGRKHPRQRLENVSYSTYRIAARRCIDCPSRLLGVC